MNGCSPYSVICSLPSTVIHVGRRHAIHFHFVSPVEIQGGLIGVGLVSIEPSGALTLDKGKRRRTRPGLAVKTICARDSKEKYIS